VDCVINYVNPREPTPNESPGNRLNNLDNRVRKQINGDEPSVTESMDKTKKEIKISTRKRRRES